MDAVAIPAEHVSQVWPMAEAWIDAALDRDRTHTPEQVAALCEAGRVQLWVVWGEGRAWAAVVTEIIVSPLKKVANIWLVGGSHRKKWAEILLSRVEEWARAQGCSSVRAVGRKGWVKDMPGYSAEHVVYAKELA